MTNTSLNKYPSQAVLSSELCINSNPVNSKSVNSVCMTCVHWVNEKCFKLGVGRRIRATIRCFCRGTSILAHLSILGYGPGRHKQPKHTHILSGSECVGAPLRTTHWWSPKNISRVTPLFSRLPSTTSGRASDSRQQLWLLSVTF